jgi:intergrase/recombinase
LQSSLSKSKKTGVNPWILSDHNAVKLEFNNKRNSRKYLNSWRLNNKFLHNQWVIKEIREEIKKFLEFNENESTTYQNPWDTANAVPRGKFIAMNAYIKNTESPQINDLMPHFKLLEEQ